MIAFLTKSDASKGFDQIVDFLNAHTIRYALMVNPPIYVSCIKQFWALVLVKRTNDGVKLQALIDRKKEEIFAELACMGYEKPPPKGLPGMNLALLWPRLSSALPQKAFANMKMIGKGFFGVETPLFDTMLVQPQVQDDAEVEEDEDDEGRMDEDVTAVKEVNAVESTVFDDEEMVKRLQDEEIEQVVARENRRKKI
nr:hypothetical protein [Tanacetum cinerariifolium]